MKEKMSLKWHGISLLGFILIMIGFIFFFVTYTGQFSHIPIYVSVFIIISGTAIVMVSVKNMTPDYASRRNMDKGYLSFLISKLPESYVRPLSLLVGSFIILLDVLIAFIGYASPGVGDADIIIIIFGISIMLYTFLPEKFSLERDFIITFFFFLSIMMAFIPLLFEMGGDGFTYYFLLIPLHKVLSFMSIENKIIPPSTLKIIDPMSKIKSDIIIARACSGIYSFSIFIASSISFILVIYRKINWKSVLFIAFAIVLAYVGNVIRMTIVTLSGYYYGPDTLSWVHETIGYPIFFAWMAFFWFILYRFLIKEDEEKDGGNDSDIS